MVLGSTLSAFVCLGVGVGGRQASGHPWCQSDCVPTPEQEQSKPSSPTQQRLSYLEDKQDKKEGGMLTLSKRMCKGIQLFSFNVQLYYENEL